MKKTLKIILAFLSVWIFSIQTSLASWDTYNMYSLPNGTINTSTWYTLMFSHIDWNFYINEDFLNILIMKFFIAFFGILIFLILSFKAFEQWKK